jgi:hypothetical protein
MKKSVFIIVLFFVSLSGFAQKSVDELFDSCKNMHDVSFVDIPKSLINSSVLPTLKDEKYRKIWKNINSVKIMMMDVSKLTPEIKAKMMSIVSDCKKEGLERIFQSNDDDGKSVVMAKPEGNKLTNLLIVFIGGDNSVFLKIDGNIRMSDLSKVSKLILP